MKKCCHPVLKQLPLAPCPSLLSFFLQVRLPAQIDLHPRNSQSHVASTMSLLSNYDCPSLLFAVINMPFCIVGAGCGISGAARFKSAFEILSQSF
jgi:hypothetical protein